MDFSADVSAEVGKIRGRSNTWPRKQNDIQANDSQETLKIKRDSPKSLRIPGKSTLRTIGSQNGLLPFFKCIFFTLNSKLLTRFISFMNTNNANIVGAS